MWQSESCLLLSCMRFRRKIRRSVVSIPSNIAEGAGRNTDNDLSEAFYDCSSWLSYRA